MTLLSGGVRVDGTGGFTVHDAGKRGVIFEHGNDIVIPRNEIDPAFRILKDWSLVSQAAIQLRRTGQKLGLQWPELVQWTAIDSRFVCVLSGLHI